MTDAIAGTFADMRFVKTRKVCQIIVELPIENADKFVRVFGTPNPHQEVWVALARLQAEPAETDRIAMAYADGCLTRTAKSTISEPRFEDGGARAVTRAAMLCKDPEFQKWISPDHSEDGARDTLIIQCGIASRSELKDNVDARMKLYRLITRFESETGRMAERR